MGRLYYIDWIFTSTGAVFFLQEVRFKPADLHLCIMMLNSAI